MRAKAAAAGFPSQTITGEQFRELEARQQVGAYAMGAGSAASGWLAVVRLWGGVLHARTARAPGGAHGALPCLE